MADNPLQGGGGQLPDDEDAAMGGTGQDTALRDMTVSTERVGDLADPGLTGTSIRDQRRALDARTRQERATDSVATRTGLDPGTDFSVTPEPVPDGRLRTTPDAGGLEVSLTAEGEQELSARRVEEQGGFETRDGQFVEAEVTPEPVPDALARTNPRAGGREVSLTPAGRSGLIVDRVEEQGGVEAQDGDLIEADPTDLQFDEEGRLSGIDRDSGGGGIGATIAAGADDVAGGIGAAAGVVPGTGVVADVTDAALDVGGDALSASANAPVVTQTLSGVRTAGDAIGSASAGAVDAANERIDSIDVTPGMGAAPGNAPLAKGVLKGAAGATVGLPAAVAGAAATAEDAVQSTQSSINEEGVIGGGLESTGAAVAVGGAAAAGTAAAAAKNPAGFGGQLAGGAIAGTAVTPLRARKLTVPRQDAPDTTVRGVEATTPPAANVLLPDRLQARRTVGGLEGRSPTLGSPTISNLDDVDVERLGSGTANRGPVFLPRSEFESEVFGKSVLDEGGQAADRFASGTALLDAGETVTGSIRTTRVDDIEPTVRAAEDVPDAADAGEIADALAEVDATVYGSGAVRAQADDFRAPGDIDIVVPDKKKAKAALEPTLEDTGRSVGEVFDVKEVGDFAGLGEGEVFALGQRSRSPTTTRERDIDVNPLGEELQRKTVASLFLRDAPIGDPGVDVGPRPVRDPDTAIREKDPKDASAIAQAIGVNETAVRRFETAFGLRERALTEGGTPDFSDASPSTLVTGSDTPSPSPAGAVAGAQTEAGSGGPLGSAPSPTSGDSPEIDAPESPSPGVNPGGSASRPPSQMADESPSPSPAPSDADSPVPSPAPSDTPSASPGPSPTPSPEPSPGPSPGPSPEPSPGPSPGPSPEPSPTPSPGPSPEPSPTPSPGPSPDPSPSPIPPPPPTDSSTPPPPPPGGGGAPGNPRRPRLPEDTDDEREDELLFASGAVGERFVNPIRRLGTGADPDVGEPPQLADQPAYDEVADPPDAYGGGR